MSSGQVVRGRGQPLWVQLAEQLTSEIRAGHRAPGSKLPSVAEQREAGLSQATTMRAYRELTARGLAVAISGSGTYVSDPVPPVEPELTLENLAARIRRLEERLNIEN